MWIVRLALKRPYTFVVFAMLILLVGSWFVVRTSKDIFPFINIPVVSVIWTFQGMPAEEFSQRITTYCEYTLSNNVNDIERIESQTLDGVGIVRLFFHPSVEIEAAVAQTSASCQSILKLMPTGVQPPTILRYNANTVPLIQMALSSQVLSEQELYDYGVYRIRQFISTIQGTTLPAPYGGKSRQVMVDVNTSQLQARGLSSRDVGTAFSRQNITAPTGDAKIGPFDYRLNMNNTPDLIASMNDFPVKEVDGKMVYVRDVAFAHDGYAPQSNIVREDGLHAVLLVILKNGAASTLDIIESVKELLKTIKAAAPPGMNINLLFDQSIFVNAAIESVIKEGALAALLTGIMILLFLGSWRSTITVWLSIPLSILLSIILLSLTGDTLNIMTLGGLALAIGILVDDATVAVENIHRNMDLGKPLTQAVLDGSSQVTIPAFVSTLAICIVFLPVSLLEGPAKFLFVPFAKAVVYAIFGSYILSRTLIPVMLNYLTPPTKHEQYNEKFEKGFNAFKDRYHRALTWSLHNRGTTILLFVLVFGSAALILPSVGEDFFPQVDAGQFRLHVRAPSGTRLEVTEEYFGAVEDEIKKIIPKNEISQIIDNIGIPASSYNLAFGDLATIGVYDGEILVSLSHKRTHSTAKYIEMLRHTLPSKFPTLMFYFQPADMVNQILNFGLPSPIDIRVMGYDKETNLKVARELVERVSRVPGAVDVHLHQVLDAPELYITSDRMRLAAVGLTQSDLSSDILGTYGTSSAVAPNFWLDRKMGIPYQISVQQPKYRTNTIQELLLTPVASPKTTQSQLLGDLVTVQHRVGPGVVNHVNIQPVFDVFANVQGRDLGAVARDIQAIVDELKGKLTPGNSIEIQGLVLSMQTAFTRLAMGFIFAIILVYCLMVVNFQSWLDPFIVIMALPGVISGIIWMLYITHTTFSVPSLMGAIMSVGVASANSILLVTFANRYLKHDSDPLQAMAEAAATRLRPILMTALAMIVGMIPMAIGLGEGSEQNVPLGRAVIGGLLIATITTLFFVPVIFTLLRKKANPYIATEEEIDAHD
ncbi:MAG: efflux RND transporter permease subunit [Chlamydiales bacterium]|nr:efflux RND transporter permease subunit [Chlamydiales bacterium]